MSVVSRKNAEKTTCSKGHPLTGDNVRIYFNATRGTPQRICKECHRSRKRVGARTTNPETGDWDRHVRMLDDKALLRLLDAYEDGVLHEDLRERFRLTDEQIKARLIDARNLLLRRVSDTSTDS